MPFPYQKLERNSKTDVLILGGGIPGALTAHYLIQEGIDCTLIDGLPYIGKYKNLLNCFFALGFGGNGITFSQVAGEIIALLIKSKKNKDAAFFSFERM